jgi:hypothetical protein
MMKTPLEARHMETWSRAAQAAGRYMRMEQPGEQDGPEGRAARATLLAELAALLDLSQQLDKALPMWQREFYVLAAQNMAEACHISLEEITTFTEALQPRCATQER